MGRFVAPSTAWPSGWAGCGPFAAFFYVLWRVEQMSIAGGCSGWRGGVLTARAVAAATDRQADAGPGQGQP